MHNKLDNMAVDKETNNVFRNILTQLAGITTDTALTSIMTANGLPAGITTFLLRGIFRGATQGVIQNCYDEIVNRTLSVREVEKHNQVFEIAERTFFELAYADKIQSMCYDLDESHLKYAYEVAEHISIEAIRQSEDVKIDVLGRFYGRSFYYADIDWQDMHQMITMVGALTLRQVVLIRLICEGFNGLDKKLFITNPSVCVELHRLLEYGIWCTNGAAFGINNSSPIELATLVPTEYAKFVCSSVMLDKLSNEDVNRVIESLKLSQEGEKQDILRLEDYKANTEWAEIDENGDVIIDGETYNE